MIEHLAHPTATEPEALTGLWETSVRATHDYLSMLFVAPGQRGKGLGGKLVNHVMPRCGIRRVDFNEQNGQAPSGFIFGGDSGSRAAIRSTPRANPTPSCI